MKLGLRNTLPIIGRFPLEDRLGIGLHVRIMIRSLDKS